MSMVCCEICGEFIDSDDDPDCFVEVSTQKTKVLCEHCRDKLQEEYDWEAGQGPQEENLK